MAWTLYDRVQVMNTVRGWGSTLVGKMKEEREREGDRARRTKKETILSKKEGGWKGGEGARGGPVGWRIAPPLPTLQL